VVGRSPQDGPTDFVGRQDELARITKLLAESRLVTIVGPGGVGKTRVAQVVAAAAPGDSHRDGAWIVDLSGLRDSELLPNTVASVLGLPEQDARSALDSVLEFLRDRRLLLLLDTCEHLLDACAALIQAVARDAAGVTFLATSRQPLDTPGEQIFPIGPLPVPEADDITPGPAFGNVARRGDAVELFALRAAAAAPGFTVTPGNVDDVVRLCRRLDGIPLAIELAAVQLRTLPLEELTQRLDDVFSVLNKSTPGGLLRHQTLHTAIQWSYDLCSPAERRIWARLSVFAGPFPLAAAEEVCAEVELEKPEVLSALIGLVDKSVLQREGARYRMLDTLREFGLEQLRQSGEEQACRERHLGRYLTLATRFGDHFADDDQMDQYQALAEAHVNLRAALDYALVDGSSTQPRWQSGVLMACSLYGYWQISGLLGEGRYWLTRALDRFRDACPERALALVNRGFLSSFQGDIAGALADCEDGIALSESLGLDAVTARGYQHMMLTLTFLGRHADAFGAADEARRRLRACDDRAGELMLMAQLGHLNQLSGQVAESVAVCEGGLEMLGAASREQWISSYLYVVSGFALFQMPGREADCERAVRKSLLGKEELGDIIGMAYALEVLGWHALKTGSPVQTAQFLGAAAALWERGGVRFSGTAIMEEFHQQAERDARRQIGADRYDAEHEFWAGYMRRQLEAFVLGDSAKLRVPL
jgi:predicted ATPase